MALNLKSWCSCRALHLVSLFRKHPFLQTHGSFYSDVFQLNLWEGNFSWHSNLMRGRAGHHVSVPAYSTFNQILHLNSLHKCHNVLLDIFNIYQLWPFLWLQFYYLLPGNFTKLFSFCKHQIFFLKGHTSSSLNTNMVAHK